jgi:hypothetical protein
MRYYHLLNFQHVMLYLFPALVFMVVFGVGLAYQHFRGKDAEARTERIIYRFPGGIEDRDAPFPLIMVLIIAGTVVWAFFYILLTGLLEVKI